MKFEETEFRLTIESGLYLELKIIPAVACYYDTKLYITEKQNCYDELGITMAKNSNKNIYAKDVWFDSEESMLKFQMKYL